MKIRKIYYYILLITLLISPFRYTSIINAMKTDADLTVSIPADAYYYANENYLTGLQVFDTYDDSINISNDELTNYILGDPFIICNLNEDKQQDEIYYFPICDKEQNVVLVFSVIGTNIGWTHSISEEMVDELNNIDYSCNSKYIMYKSNNNLVAENKESMRIMCGKIDSNIQDICNMDLAQKQDVIEEVEDNFIKTNVTSDEESSNIIVKDMYSPAFSVSSKASTICSLYNKKGQGSYGACWAATSATIINYRKGKNVGFKTICNNRNIGYDEGGNISDASMALQDYDIMYPNLNLDSSEKMSWSNLKLNINSKYPIYVSCSGHAVSVYGYEKRNNTNYVCIWNTGLNSGNGGTQVVPYISTGTTFSYANTTWKWHYSLSMY